MTGATALPVISAEGLSKHFDGRVAVDALDLRVEPGVCYGLLGPNGAGKTTTLRMIYGVTRPTAGTVRVFGLDIASHRRAVRARLGVTLQENVLVDALTPEENLKIFGRYHLIQEPELSKRIDSMIEFLSLGSHRRVPARNLSGGFRRRLAIAMSLINNPELLVLDEPTTGLDPAVRLALWSRVRELRAGGTTVLLTTHYMDEAERLCDRVGIVSEGKLIAEGTPRELIEKHLARETLEIDCRPEEEAELLLDTAAPALRLRAGGRLILHLDDAARLAERIRLRETPRQRLLVVRPTTLEDVFLKLTGASLESSQ